MTLNFIQDVATPHNNTLLKELKNLKTLQLRLWYCHDKHPQYQWNRDLTNSVLKASFYKSDSIDWQFLVSCLKNKKEKYFLVGWMNPTTKLLVVLFTILQRPFNIWFDFPHDQKERSFIQKIFRNFFYFLLKNSNAKIFCVGSMTVDYFKNRGFHSNQLINLPVFIDLDKSKEVYKVYANDLFEKFNILSSDLFISSGSRLIYEKGYDILIEAISRLNPSIKKNIKCVIVGKGDQKVFLEELLKKYQLADNIYLEEWMEIDDFKALVANSHIFVHPARFDAYGGTIVAMALGTAVIGSINAGAAKDRILNDYNGWLYNSTVDELAKLIERVFLQKEHLVEYGKNAFITANKWHPCIGAKIIKENII